MATTRTRSKAGKARSFTLTLTPAERARADRLAKREDRSVSSLLRLALKDYCDRAEGLTTIQDRTQDHGAAESWPRNPFDQHGKKA
jgi:predicted transcriptional regulator